MHFSAVFPLTRFLFRKKKGLDDDDDEDEGDSGPDGEDSASGDAPVSSPPPPSLGGGGDGDGGFTAKPTMDDSQGSDGVVDDDGDDLLGM